MIKICEENRLQIEKEFLALVLNKNEVIELLQIKKRLSYEYSDKNFHAGGLRRSGSGQGSCR